MAACRPSVHVCAVSAVCRAGAGADGGRAVGGGRRLGVRRQVRCLHQSLQSAVRGLSGEVQGSGARRPQYLQAQTSRLRNVLPPEALAPRQVTSHPVDRSKYTP